jgi:Cytochrome c
MSVVRGWAWVVACAGLVAVSGSSWIGRDVAAAQQRPAAATPVAPAGLKGDVAHGRYLVEKVAMCGECHSSRDEAGTIIESTRLRGGSMPVRVPWPADWPLQVPRIIGLPAYTDAEAMRLLTEGAVKRNGTKARAPMPRYYMTPQDAADVIAFLRSM